MGKFYPELNQTLRAFLASLVLAGDSVLALSDSGDLIVSAADPKAYRPVATYKVAEPGAVWSQLTVVGSRVFVKDKEHLACYDFAPEK